VKNELSVQPVTEREESRQSLAELREALLRLHKALIESERAGYEKTFGKIVSPFHFLQLLGRRLRGRRRGWRGAASSAKTGP